MVKLRVGALSPQQVDFPYSVINEHHHVEAGQTYRDRVVDRRHVVSVSQRDTLNVVVRSAFALCLLDQSTPQCDTAVNLDQHCQSNHISVILVEIPRGFITDYYGGFERRLARKYDLQLVSDTMIRQLVYLSAVIPPRSWLESNRHLSEDGLHPNSRGNQVLARKIWRAVKQLTGQ